MKQYQYLSCKADNCLAGQEISHTVIWASHWASCIHSSPPHTTPLRSCFDTVLPSMPTSLSCLFFGPLSFPLRQASRLMKSPCHLHTSTCFFPFSTFKKLFILTTHIQTFLQDNLFFFISNLIHCFSVYVQYLLSSFLYMFQASQGENTIGCMYNLNLLMMGL